MKEIQYHNDAEVEDFFKNSENLNTKGQHKLTQGSHNKCLVISALTLYAE